MELCRLSENFYPEDLIEGYASLTWAERYTPAGDFTATFANIEEAREQLPLRSWVSLMDSRELMMVENHLIEKDEEGQDVVKISGRSFEAVILESRVIASHISEIAPPLKVEPTEGPTGVVEALIQRTLFTNPLQPNDEFPHPSGSGYLFNLFDDHTAEVEDSEAAEGVMVNPGVLYDEVLRYLPLHDLGIRNERPGMSKTAPDWERIIMLVTDGRNKTVHQAADDGSGNAIYEPVIFSVANGDFVDVSYLFSVKDEKTVAYVFSPLDSRAVYLQGVLSGTGLERNTLFVNASEISDETLTGAQVNALMRNRGTTDLKQHRGDTVFDGRVSPNATYKFGEDYLVGDLVTVNAEYGISQTMRVTEFVRTEDRNGESGYPTLKKLAGPIRHGFAIEEWQ